MGFNPRKCKNNLTRRVATYDNDREAHFYSIELWRNYIEAPRNRSEVRRKCSEAMRNRIEAPHDRSEANTNRSEAPFHHSEALDNRINARLIEKPHQMTRNLSN